MHKEVDEKIKRITARSNNVDQYGSLLTSDTPSIYPDLNTLLTSTQSGAARGGDPRTQDSDADTDVVMADTETLVSSVGLSPQTPQQQPQRAGQKRPRKGAKHPNLAPSSEGDSSNGAEDPAERSPKKRRMDLDEDVELNVADASTIASSKLTSSIVSCDTQNGYTLTRIL
jgi:hypothetical protein